MSNTTKTNCTLCTHKGVCKYENEFKSIEDLNNNNLPNNALISIKCVHYLEENIYNPKAPRGGNVAQKINYDKLPDRAPWLG